MLNRSAAGSVLQSVGWHDAAWALMAATLALFATETLFNVPFWILSVAGVWLAVRQPRALRDDPLLRHAGLLFLCLWIPQLAALTDAANPGRSAFNALAYIHFYFAAVFVLTWLRDPVATRRFEIFIFVVITLWILDALLQYFTGENLLGYPYRRGQLTGLFDPKIRLGHMLAVLLPAYCEVCRRLCRGRAWWLLLPLLACAVILLSGKRVAWVMAFISAAGYGLFLLHIGVLSLRTAAAGILVAVLAGGALLSTNQPLARRAEATLGLFSGDLSAVDRATSHRLPLWETAINIASHHWINGVGTRGYRYVFRDFAAADNYFLRDGREGQTHPHQMVLEVAAETGVIGIAGLLAFWWLLLRRARQRLWADATGIPWMLSGIVAWLPFNAHLAFYGSYWSSVCWWALLAMLAMTASDGSRREPA